MSFFKNRELPVRPVCVHKWQDFDWYLEWEKISDGTGFCVAKYSIIEPYVCIHCKERMNKVLESRKLSQCTSQQADAFLREVREHYPQIKDRPVVEDEIADMQLVDRDYLRIAKMVMGSTHTVDAGRSLPATKGNKD